MRNPIRVPVTTSERPRPSPLFPWSTPVVLAGIAGAIIVVSLLISMFAVMNRAGGGGNDETTGMNPPETAPSIAMATATPEPCQPASNWIDQLTYLMDKGLWKQAADSARVALATPDLCDAGQDDLQELAISAGLEALFDEPFDPRDLVTQQAQVDRYYRLREQAARERVEFPTDVVLARRARAGGQFLLAKAAFEEAIDTGALQPDDRQNLRAYVSTLHDLGRWWLTNPNDGLHEQGAELLATCMALDVEYRLGSGACYGALQELVSPHPANWPRPAEHPLLTLSTRAERRRYATSL